MGKSTAASVVSVYKAGRCSSLCDCKHLTSRVVTAHSSHLWHDRYTALHWAAKRGDVELFQLLSPHVTNADPKSSGGYTPLHLACLHGHHGIQALLKDIGANERLLSNRGYSTNDMRRNWEVQW